jgi:hypothetical protein
MHGDRAPRAGTDTSLHVSGWVTVYRLHDIGNAIDLEAANSALQPVSAARARPARGEAQAIQIANPPLSVALGTATLPLHGDEHPVTFSARVFDFGVCALQARTAIPDGLTWEGLGVLGARLEAAPALVTAFATALDRVTGLLGSAVERPERSPVSESYVVFRVTTLHDGAGHGIAPTAVSDAALARLLLNETEPLSAGACADLLQYRFSYYDNDLAILTWDNALVVDPRTSDEDVEYVLEFANAQLLELRVYDAALDAELPQMYDRIAAARGQKSTGALGLPKRPLREVLGGLQTRVADVTETVERAENALKVTDDVYLARVYAGALKLFRASAWRRGIDRKLEIMRQTYAMLNDEEQSARSHRLEVIVVLLILAEVAIALVWR